MAQRNRWVSPLLTFPLLIGIPAGCGKTVLWYVATSPVMPAMIHIIVDCSFVCCKIRSADKRSAKVINDLQNHCGVDESVGLTYFYIDGSDPKSLSIEDLYRSCLSQLASRKRILPRNLDNLYSRYGPGGYYTTKEPVPAKQLRSALHELLTHFDHTYIAFDALDEAEDSIGLEKIITFLESISSKISIGRVHLVIFSRDLEQLRSLFQELGATSIAVDGSVLDLDLQTALRHELCSHPKFARWPVAVKKSVEGSLLTNANGSYVEGSKYCDVLLMPLTVQVPLAGLPVANLTELCDSRGSAKGFE